ncbi:MAG: phosphodiester glycosidase family protein [Phycisphaerales bacterium]
MSASEDSPPRLSRRRWSIAALIGAAMLASAVFVVGRLAIGPAQPRQHTVRSATGSSWTRGPIALRRFERLTPDGPIRGLVARLDLRDPMLELVTTEPLSPDDASADGPGVEARLRRLDAWLDDTRACFAVNANFYGRLPRHDSLLAKARGWTDGEPVDILGLAGRGDALVSSARQWNGRPDPSLLIGSDRIARIGFFTDDDARGVTGPLAHLHAPALIALSGLGPGADDPERGTLLVENGRNLGATARPQPDKRHPRTAFATTPDGHTLIIAVIDGRQPDHSIGITLPELAELLIDEGADSAINADGGGSTGMILILSDGSRITNLPSEGRFRPIANHFGVRLRSPAPE